MVMKKERRINMDALKFIWGFLAFFGDWLWHDDQTLDKC